MLSWMDEEIGYSSKTHAFLKMSLLGMILEKQAKMSYFVKNKLIIIGLYGTCFSEL
jgi:hypothetical protein